MNESLGSPAAKLLERSRTSLPSASGFASGTDDIGFRKEIRSRDWVRRMPKLTECAVAAIRPDLAGREIFVWDNGLRGFGLRMMPSGTASYLAQYPTAEGPSRRLRIGKLGQKVFRTPGHARLRPRSIGSATRSSGWVSTSPRNREAAWARRAADGATDQPAALQ